MSISRLTVSWLAGAKVADISIHSKHICLFFETFLKQFRKWLIDKDVVEHKFEREDERRGKGVHYYIYARVVCACKLNMQTLLFQVHTSTKTSSHEREGLEKWNKKEWIMQAAFHF